MKFRITKDILEKAGQCREDYSCVHGSPDCLCEVNENLNNVVFVKPGSMACDYSLRFGHAYTCNCPVRKEIYSLYKK